MVIGMSLDVQKIKQLRLKAGLSQADAANRAGIKGGRQGWYNIESGRQSNPTLQTLERIARVLGVTVPALLK